MFQSGGNGVDLSLSIIAKTNRFETQFLSWERKRQRLILIETKTQLRKMENLIFTFLEILPHSIFILVLTQIFELNSTKNKLTNKIQIFLYLRSDHGWARDGTGQSRDFLSRSRLSRGTTMRDSPAKICPGPARPADFCPGPGPTGHKQCRDRSGLASRGTVPQVPTYISLIT